MKHFYILLVVMMSLTLFSSCQKDDYQLQPGIVYTNNPPEKIFGNNIYASTNKCWIEQSDFSDAKSLGYSSNQFWDQERQYYVSYDSGEWRLVPARKFWGILDGIIYLSESKDWYVISPQNYIDGWNFAEEKKTITAYSCTGCQNPFGRPSITGFE